MKKQKFTKQQAYVGNPALVNSFSAPASHDGELSIVFRNKDAKIHGHDGSSWSLLYTWDGEDSHFTFSNTYQSYYIESLTGQQETFGVSFFSSDKYQGSTPSLAGVDRGVKLYDIDEVPIYTASDVNKMLTIMSDGSLRWLLANESFVIPAEGGESNAPTYSELTPSGDAAVVDGQIQTNGGYFSALWSDFVSYTGDTPDNSDFTVAFWWKHGETPVAGVTPTFGLFSGRNDSLSEGMNYFIMDHAASGVRLQTNFGASYFANRENLISEDPNVEHPWNHFVFTRTATTTKTYWNGALVANHGANFPWVPNSAASGFNLGASDESGSNSSQNTLFEDFEIRDGEAMSASDILDLYNAGRVSQQAGGGEGGDPAPQANFLEDLERLNIPNGIYDDNGHGQGHRLIFNLDGDNIIDYGADGEPVEEEFTISWWMNLDSSQAANSVSVLGHESSRRFMLNMSNAGAVASNPFLQIRVGGNYIFYHNTGVPLTNWTHAAIVCSKEETQLRVRMYLNGVQLPGSGTYPLGSKLLPAASNDQFSWGGSGQSGKSVKGQFDSMQIEDGIALTGAQVAAMAAQTDRQMGIEAASLV
jgi:hypothetical protein